MDGQGGGRDTPGPGVRAPWVMDEIPFQDLDRDQIRDNRQLFHGLAAASFVEITANL